MRPIKFRGKRLDNGEWLIGSLIQRGGRCFILPFRGEPRAIDTEVDPATVGQFTGLLDKNGRRIWEGDILEKTGDKDGLIYDGMDKGRRSVATMETFPVFWLTDETFGYEGEDLEDNNHWEVIGNIHDNPELLNPKQL